MTDETHQDRDYIGWVPCLIGELLYSRARPGLAEYDAFVVNFETFSAEDSLEKTRFIAASSVYDWKDSGSPQESGVFRVVLTACTEPGDTTSLQGHLYFISDLSRQTTTGGETLPRSCPNEEDLLLSLKTLERRCAEIERSRSKQDIVSLYRAFRTLQEYFRGPGENPPGKLIHHIDGIQNKHVHKVAFTLDNFGFCRLRYLGLKDPLSAEYAPQGLPRESPLRRLRLEEQHYTLCRQAFYYLKFLFHKHAHHDHSNDSLATVHRYRGENYDTARALLHDLKAALVDLKRADRQDDSRFAGIATYGKSLVTSCYKANFFREGPVPSKEYTAQHDYFDHLSQSVNLLRERRKPLPERRRQRLATIQQLLAIIFLFVTPLILVGIKTPTTVDAAATIASVSPLGYLQHIASRLGNGDIGLLLSLYSLILFTVVMAHQFHLDKIKVFDGPKPVFDLLRTRAFSSPKCRDRFFERLIWPAHITVVRTRRLLRGIAYKELKQKGLAFGLHLFMFVIMAALTAFTGFSLRFTADSLQSILYGS